MKYTTKRRQKLHFHLHFMPHFTCFSCFLRPWMKRFASHCCCCCCWRCYLAAHWRRLHQSQNNHGPSSSVCRGASCGTTRPCLCVSVCCLESAPTRVLCSLGSKSRSQSHLPPHLTLPPSFSSLSPAPSPCCLRFLIALFIGKIHVYKRLAAYYLFIYVSCNWKRSTPTSRLPVQDLWLRLSSSSSETSSSQSSPKQIALALHNQAAAKIGNHYANLLLLFSWFLWLFLAMWPDAFHRS